MFTSMDVYDAAASIGHECQLIVSQYGSDVLQTLLPKVISVLEDLEVCAVYGEQEQEEVTRLQNVVEQLRGDCRTQVEMKQQLDRNMEQLEQSWYSETQRLMDQVALLEKENNSLAQQLASGVIKDEEDVERKTSGPCSGFSDETSSIRQPTAGAVVRSAAAGKTLPTRGQETIREKKEDMISSVLYETEECLRLSDQENHVANLQTIGRLKDCVASNYKMLRSLNQDILQTGAAIDAAEDEVCRLARQSGQLRAARAPHRRQMGHLVAEKAHLESKLLVHERQLTELNEKLPTKERELNSNSFKTADLKGKNTSSPGRSKLVTSKQSLLPPTCALPPTVHLSLGQGVESAVCEAVCPVTDDEGLVTLEELRHILYERNELRCRLIELEQELKVLELENSNDPEVEGPLPREPIEKLRPGWCEKTDIKTLFRQLLHRLTERTSVSE